MKKIMAAVMLFCCLVVSSRVEALTVVIDAGHGGKDPGAIGYSYQEKNINLKVALKVGQAIKESYPDVKVVYTRSTDVYITLQERAAIANRANGDLFISIHTNACESHNAVGTETFTLGLAKTNANFEVAKRENSVMLLENDKEVYQGFDPTSPDSYIMFELMQSTYIDLSILMADYVQTEFTTMGRSDRGVRQAGFWVLHQVKMPSVLIELGFITNAAEEKYLGSDDGVSKLSTCIVNAFTKYKHEYDKKSVKSQNQGGQASADDDKKAKSDDDKKVKNEDGKKSKSEDGKKSKSEDGKKSKGKDAKNKTKEPSTSVTPDTISGQKPDESTKADENTIIYKVQCFATNKKVDKSVSEYRNASKFGEVSSYCQNGLYKYTVGEFTTMAEANALLKRVQQVFKSAFIVQFKNGERIK